MRTIAVINQKGGVGKTTTTANLAHALTLNNYKVITIDLDPQGHLAASFGVHNHEIAGVDDVLLHGASITDCTIEVREGLKLIQAGSKLAKVEQKIDGGVSRGTLLRNALENKFTDQDFVLIDCPPASGLLVVNALFCTNEVLVPVVGDYLSLQGLSYLMGTFKNFEEKLGHKFKEHIVFTRYHKRRRLPEQILDKLQYYFPEQILKTRIREVAALAECPGVGKTIFEYRKNSNGAHDYHALAGDLVAGRVM
jgi:chromosome partitioning protein